MALFLPFAGGFLRLSRNQCFGFYLAISVRRFPERQLRTYSACNRPSFSASVSDRGFRQRRQRIRITSPGPCSIDRELNQHDIICVIVGIKIGFSRRLNKMEFSNSRLAQGGYFSGTIWCARPICGGVSSADARIRCIRTATDQLDGELVLTSGIKPAPDGCLVRARTL